MKKILTLMSLWAISMYIALNALAATEREQSCLSFGYMLNTFTANKKLEGYFGKDSHRSLDGFFMEYSYYFHGAKTLPIMGEVGVNFQMGFYSKQKSLSVSSHKSINKTQAMAITVPISAGYRFKLYKSLSIQPFLGIDPKYNVMLRSKATFNKAYFNTYKTLGIKESDSAYQWKNYLSDNKKTGMGSSKDVWSSIQLGWHVGLYVIYGKVRYSVRYGTDFIPAYSNDKKRINSSQLYAGIGFFF